MTSRPHLQKLVEGARQAVERGRAHAQPGLHQVIAIVKDSGGRADYETRLVFVNGPLTVRVESPADGAVVKTIGDAVMLVSPDPAEKRITYGCINVPTAFFENVVRMVVRGGNSIVYVMPESRPLRSVFGQLAVAYLKSPESQR